MEIELTQLQQENSAVDSLMQSMEEAKQQEQEVSPLLEDVVEFMRANPDELFELVEKNPGRLIQEGDDVPLYILLATKEPPNVYKKVDLNGIQQELHIGKLRTPTVIGEISRLLDKKATASVDLLFPTTLIQLTSEQFERMSTSETFRQRHTDLANERLQRQLDVMERVDAIVTDQEKAHVPDGFAGSLQEIISLEESYQKAVQGEEITKTFELESHYRADKIKYRKEAFTTKFAPSPNNDVVDVKITSPNDPSLIIQMRLSDHCSYVSIGPKPINMGKSRGYGFYSAILDTFLEKTTVIESVVTEKDTMNKVVDTYPAGQIIPHSTLAAESRVVSARHNFLSVMQGRLPNISSYRIDKKLSRILRLATDMERDVVRIGGTSVAQKYQLPKSDLSRILLILSNQYMQSESSKTLPKEAQEALGIQHERIKELCSQE